MMKIRTKRLLQIAARYGVSLRDLAEMFGLYVETLKYLLRYNSILELDCDQAANLIQWFGAADAFRMMTVQQMREVVTNGYC